MKREYLIKTYGKKEDIVLDEIPSGAIDTYAWSDKYTPPAYFKLCFVKDEGFYLYLRCKEKDPRAECEGYMSPVYTDSCLEFFADYGNGGYINIECNSKGACLSAHGIGRGNRTPILQIAGEIPTVVPVSDNETWGVDVFVPLSILEKVYGKISFDSGYEFYGNAYKCGDKCEIPHYGTWNRVETERPDFHRPEYFGIFKMI